MKQVKLEVNLQKNMEISYLCPEMKLIRSILAMLLAGLILVTTTGFSLSQHFCQGELLYSSLAGKTGCSMQMNSAMQMTGAMQMNGSASCETGKPTTQAFGEKPCCEDHQATVAGQDLPTPLKKGESLLPSVKFIAAFTYTFFTQPRLSVKDDHFIDYRPPLISRDLPVFYQSFLI